MTAEEIFKEERLTLAGIHDIVTLAKINGKYLNGEEYYLHMAKRAKELAMSDYSTGSGGG